MHWWGRAMAPKNGSAKVWDLASIDWDVSGLPGAGFKDGPFMGFSGRTLVL